MNEISVDEAYRFCSKIARHEAKNFFYAFRVLPKVKRNAMCAVYAFMRQADDLADDESISVAERRLRMNHWLHAWRGSRAHVAGEQRTSEESRGEIQDPVFVALADSQRRFNIPDGLLEDLVRGTTLDLTPEEGAEGSAATLEDGMQGYRTAEDLYRYCYLVASVVGLVCIHIFGYSDPRAALLAERTGIAFQLTNILRDVKEDAERGRIYLPQRLLQEFGVSNSDILGLAAGKPMRAKERAMISALSVETWVYYKSAAELLPLIDRDSRAALWVLVKIYSSLLHRIDRRQGDVFSSRVHVSPLRKLFAMLSGAALAIRMRLR